MKSRLSDLAATIGAITPPSLWPMTPIAWGSISGREGKKFYHSRGVLGEVQ